MFIMEAKAFRRKKKNKTHIGRWVLLFFALLVTFSPTFFKKQILAHQFKIGPKSDLLLTTFYPQVQHYVCKTNYNQAIGIGGIEVDKPSMETLFYTVHSGDTLGEIAQRQGIKVETILGANQSVKSINSLRVGQRLRIPNQDGIFHKVQNGQTLSNISKTYKVSLEKILDTNDISRPTNLIAGKEVFIPGAKLLPSSKEYLLGGIGFIRPVTAGHFSSGYGYRRDPFNGSIQFHTGIDFAAYQGTSIRASRSGKVVCSDWVNGYGNTIVIEHTGGYATRYAHNSKNLVSKGMYVNQGQVIGLVGNTGRSMGAHLHFEILKNGRPVNPSSFISLPRRG
ncbi:MAG: M23 family metallopeptidase [bacterium]|nr:M23 family metallopeptidase [bacterium]